MPQSAEVDSLCDNLTGISGDFVCQQLGMLVRAN